MLSSLFVLVVALISNYRCNGWRQQTSFINLDVYAFRGPVCVLRQCSLIMICWELAWAENTRGNFASSDFCLDFEMSAHFLHKTSFRIVTHYTNPPGCIIIVSLCFIQLLILSSACTAALLCSIIIPEWIPLKFSAPLHPASSNQRL